jgi:hypothetical protein
VMRDQRLTNNDLRRMQGCRAWPAGGAFFSNTLHIARAPTEFG